MSFKPEATVEQRPIYYVVDGKAPGTRGPTGGEKVASKDKFETVRHGTCPDHQKPSMAFEGVNESGWIFRCAGYTANGMPCPEARHYFINRAPAGPRSL